MPRFFWATSNVPSFGAWLPPEATSESSQHVSASQLRFVRTVRLARALRGIRVMRLLRYVSALRTLVLSIMSSLAKGVLMIRSLGRHWC
jgi:hypothetical protein